FGTDPVTHEILFAGGEREIVRLVEEHSDSVTYGENIGRQGCPIPPLPGLRSRTRQPVLLDLWELGPSPRKAFTTVANWKQTGNDVVYQGQTYYWSKHREFLKFIELPERVRQPIELALAFPHLDGSDRRLLEAHRWSVVDALPFTLDPWSYRDYVRSSSAEFTVAKDQNVRLRSGWFSERSACYLAAGRPVITQDTGFGTVLPTGEGLFAFNSLEEIVEAFEKVISDYSRHSRAARAIAEEYFRAETVLAKVLDDLDL
ncbi:MAG: glycosyltransferase, partial [Candidatus Binatia bacterium]